MSDYVADTEDPQDGFVSWPEFLARTDRAALALVCLAVWLHAADSLIVATMLPAIVGDIGGAELVGWSIALYELGSIVAGAGSALLTMRRGLRMPMSLAAALFAAGCAISAFSPTMPVLLAGRCLQGLGGGGLVSMCFISVGLLFERRDRARALAAVSLLWGVSAFLGPLIGGVFVDYLNWRLGFGFFAAQAVAPALWIALSRAQLSHRVQGDATTFPVTRLALLCLGVLLIAAGGIDVAPLRTTLLVLAGIVLLAAFLLRDARAGVDRLLPNHPLDPRTRTGAALAMLLFMSIATIAILGFGPILMAVIHGVTPLTAGYIIACSSIGWTVTAIVVSGAPERLDPLFIALGMGATALSVPAFAYAVPHGPVWLIAAVAAVEGGGFGLAWTFVMRRGTVGATPEEAQRFAGAMPVIQRLGLALGAAYAGIVANAAGFLTMQTPAEAGAVARAIFLAGFPFAAAGLIAMIGLVRR
ncbi:MFS transporter [Pseudoruegeria sp. HB172150]|uniref:MFS transporter n=1 Tax=Pseudoruegeria sp. HB172150 TaxID=2721164 RepID=UPI0015573F51|nr:MFS transporter [Pseudoruegeria sp. HB172150]